MTTITVWWLLIHAGGMLSQPPVFVPEPYATEESCRAAGEAFKDSPIDLREFGMFACIPGDRKSENN